MRRKDREITEKEEIIKIIEQCDTCRLGFCDQNKPYVVPMNYGYTYENDQLIMYFHGAREGRKLEIIKENNNVCFQMDCCNKLIRHDIPCRYTMQFKSVMGNGKIYCVTDEQEKIEGLQHIMRRYSEGKEHTFESKHVKIISVLKLIVEDFTGKQSTKGGPIEQ